MGCGGARGGRPKRGCSKLLDYLDRHGVLLRWRWNRQHDRSKTGGEQFLESGITCGGGIRGIPTRVWSVVGAAGLGLLLELRRIRCGGLQGSARWFGVATVAQGFCATMAMRRGGCRAVAAVVREDGTRRGFRGQIKAGAGDLGEARPGKVRRETRP